MTYASQDVLRVLLIAYPQPMHLVEISRDINLGGMATRQAVASLIGRLAANPDMYIRIWKPDDEVDAWAITIDRPTV